MPDFVRRFFVSCAQISEAYAARMLIKFGCDWRKIGHKGRCMKGFERTYRKGGRQMVERKAFLKAYNIDEDDFNAADISWEELAAIYDDYLLKEEKLRGIGKDFVNDYLYDIERAGIHSYRYRTKHPGHL